MDATEIFSKRLEIIDKALEEALLPESKPRELYDAVTHLIKAGGKKYRPALTLLACEAVGGNAEDALSTAIAVELLHTASLIHDDILDGDTLRRGVRTVHSIWGNEVAIIAGDLLIGKAVEILTLATPPKVINLIARASAEMCEGEVLDVRYHGNLDRITEQEYLEMVRKKSASLIRAAVEAGATIGGGSPRAIKALSQYGELIGIAFQLRDDVLNVTSTKTRLGKPVRTDMLTWRPNLVLIHALNASSKCEAIHTFVRSKGSAYALEKFIKKLNEMGALEYVQALSESFSKKAKNSLKNISLKNNMKKALKTAADFASQRQF